MGDRKKVIIDAGHGGSDPGASYYGRREKDDVLNLALAVGDVLSNNGITTIYTRMDDTYQTPFEKAAIANEAEADYFISLHRNAMPNPNTGSGVESLVFENTGIQALLAANINSELAKVGYRNLGIVERPGLVVLRRTQMPSVLVEVGFLDNEADNQFFDRNFKEIAEAIAAGIIATMSEVTEDDSEEEYYQIQVGAYKSRGLGEQLLTQLQSQGIPAFMVYEDGYYKVVAGSFEELDSAVNLEKTLRGMGYPTLLVKSRALY